MPPLTLRFSRPWPNARSPITLRFGDDGGGTPEPTIDSSFGIEVGLGWHALSAPEQALLLAEHAAAIEAAEALAWQGAGCEDALAVNLDTPPAIELASHSRWQGEAHQSEPLHLGWNASEAVELASGGSWRTGPLHREQNQLYWRETSHSSETTPCWTHGKVADEVLRLGWFGPPVGDEHRLRWGPHAAGWRCSNRYRPPKGKITLRFSESLPPQQSPITLRFTPSPTVCEYDGGGGLIDGSPVLPPFDFKVPIEPQLRRSYLMTPEITCSRLSDGVAIVLRSVSLQHSRSQWALTCNLVFSSKGDAERADGQAVKLSVNGYDFYLLLESPSSSKSFGQSVYSAAGRGLLAELAAPNKKAINYTNLVARSFMGLAADAVANTSWTVATTLTDYSIPAGAWSYAGKTPAEALHLMAVSIGAMLDVDGATRTITFIPRWPVSPWAVASATPDVVLHDGVILDISERREIRPSANAVFVRGEQQGVAAKVKLFGTAGDEFAGDVVDKLITDNQAARLRGTHELAEAGDKQQTQIRTKLMADLPPIRPGMLVGVRQGADLFKATCDSWQLTATVNGDGKVVVNQSLTLLRNAA